MSPSKLIRGLNPGAGKLTVLPLRLHCHWAYCIVYRFSVSTNFDWHHASKLMHCLNFCPCSLHGQTGHCTAPACQCVSGCVCDCLSEDSWLGGNDFTLSKYLNSPGAKDSLAPGSTTTPAAVSSVPAIDGGGGAGVKTVSSHTAETSRVSPLAFHCDSSRDSNGSKIFDLGVVCMTSR